MDNTIETIPSDELIEMTDIFHRAFNAAGCDPMCHCCENMIPVGHNFKLATIYKVNAWSDLELKKAILMGEVKPTVEVIKDSFGMNIRKEFEEHDLHSIEEVVKNFTPESKEVMLCETCSPELFLKKQVNEIDKEIEQRNKPRGGCFRINGKIIH